MELDGHRLETALGTDRATTALRTDVSKKLYQFDEKSSDGYQAAADSTGQDRPYYRAMAINSNGLSVINARVNLIIVKDSVCTVKSEARITGYSGCYAVHPLTLGRNVLAKLHIYLATQEGLMYFTAADAVQTATTH